MPTPVIVRNPNNKWEWHVFVPGDNNGEYWTRIDMGVPQNKLAYNKSFVIREMFYGKVRPGRVIPAQAGGAHPCWTESGSFSNQEWGAVDWYGRQTTTQNDYVDFDIPAGYNRISFMSYDVSGGSGAMLAISWDDDSTTGLDVTSYDSGTITKLREIVVATNANPDGVKKLRIKHDDASGTMRLVGVRCWDTDGAGDPSTERVSGFAEGHDLVDNMKITSASSQGLRQSVAGQDTFRICSAVTGASSPSGFAVAWSPTVGDNKWVGSAHFLPGDAPYTYHSGEFANGPTIMIDGVAKDSVFDDANNPKNTLLTGASIVFRSRGFSDYNEDTNEDANEAHLTWMFEFSPTGFGQVVTIDWQADCDVSTAYCGMLALDNKENGMEDGDYLTVLPDETKHDLYGAGGVNETGCQSCELVLVDFPCIIRVMAYGPMRRVYFEPTPNKLYMTYKPEAMPGGITPTSTDDIWVLGFRFQIYKRRKASPRIKGTLIV